MKTKSNADRFCELAEQIVNATPPTFRREFPTIENIVLELMRKHWGHMGNGESSSDSAAIEIAINQLLDKAKELNFIAAHQGEEIGAMGITIRDENGEDEVSR